jgi:site-specific recombinase XerD
VLRRFHACCKKAGIEIHNDGGTIAVDVHALRVTFATQALANGASVRDVQSIVGHSDPGLTMRIYAQTTNQGRRAAIDALPFVTSTPALRIASGD